MVIGANLFVNFDAVAFDSDSVPAHELRNEVVEELNSDLVSQSGANLDSKLVRGNKNSGMENEKGRKGENVVCRISLRFSDE